MTRPYETLDRAERLALAEHAVDKARQALQRGERRIARRYAEQAAALAPEREDPWLLMGALASPRASVSYLERALRINPSSLRARKGMEWALGRMPTGRPAAVERGVAQRLASAPPASSTEAVVRSQVQRVLPRHPRARRSTTPDIFIYGVATLFLVVILFAISLSPYYPQLVDSVVNDVLAQTKGLKYRPESIPALPAGPTLNPGSGETQSAEIGFGPSETPVLGPSDVPTETPTFTPTEIPTSTPTELPSPTPPPSETPPPTTAVPTLAPTPLPSPTLAPPTPVPAVQPTKKPKKKLAVNPGLRPPSVTLNDRWVDVDLSGQVTYAMQGDQVMRSFVVSTGRWPTVTVLGVYKIYVKYRTANMSGDDYFLPNVPYVMYFFKGYGLHGTYWHNNFGTPMSHGCVNLRPDDAAWLFDFASVGTIVNVHE